MSEKENLFKKYKFLFPIILAIVAFSIFANTLGGDFVYDDKRQILKNPLIQDATLYGKALTSDVWAFKGDGSIAASNYYRPTFVLWMIFNYLIFGAEPFGWHLLNILLHVAICVLGFLLLKKWNLDDFTAFGVAFIFAIHPVHTESVAWISGSPDLLFSLFFLASLWFADNFAKRYSNETNEKHGAKYYLDLIFALVFYAFALGSKEVAILCFPIFYLIFAKESGKQNAVKLTIPFAIFATIYFIARYFAIGAISHPTEESVSFGEMIFTIPAMFVFYLKQTIFPLWLGANHPLRPIDSFDFVKFLIPLLISIAVLVGFFLLAKRCFVQKIGLAIFILTLLPAMNATGFMFEQIVHDRYLYFPLLGFLMLVLPFFVEMFEKFFGDKAKIAFISFIILLAIPLSIKTYSYNKVWTNEFTLWKQAVEIDPKSAFNWSQLGAILSEEKQTDAAIEAYNNSIDVRPTALAYLGLGRNFLAQKQFEEAVFNARIVIEMPKEKVNAYTLFQAYELETLALTMNNKLPQAEKSLLEARKVLPIYYAALTEKLAVVLYQQNRKQDALKELESAKNQAKAEFLPSSKTVLLRLGMLYFEQGNRDEAKKVLQEYLKITSSLSDELTVNDRKQAVELLKKLQ
ncbi:MAG TPA: tetratricopeptide repeat protein [Pyrinomonadaceae bacterium]|nr:tetratricopeptide repeat protein [Pyrinomonadaceae bacterium]